MGRDNISDMVCVRMREKEGTRGIRCGCRMSDRDRKQLDFLPLCIYHSILSYSYDSSYSFPYP